MTDEPLALAIVQARDRADALSADLMRLLTQHAERMDKEVTDEIIDAANLSTYIGQNLRKLAADLWPGEPRKPGMPITPHLAGQLSRLPETLAEFERYKAEREHGITYSHTTNGHDLN